jgi:hypothetical protein
MSNNNCCDNYYKIVVSYELTSNILDDQSEDIRNLREILYKNIKESIPSRYEIFSVKLTIHELMDTNNYVITYDAFFRSLDGLPMEEYVAARDIKDKIKSELEQFFDSADCDYRFINIKTLL